MQLSLDDMTFGEWVRTLPLTPWEDTPYTYRDDDGNVRILRGKQLAARSIDERADTKAKQLEHVKRAARKRKRRMTAGEFTPNEAAEYLRRRLNLNPSDSNTQPS